MQQAHQPDQGGATPTRTLFLRNLFMATAPTPEELIGQLDRAEVELKEKQRKIKDARKRLGLDPTSQSVRDRDAERKKLDSLARRIVRIPAVADIERRRELEADQFKWHRFYFGEIFTYEFTAQQREMLLAIARAIKYGGDQAIAASRGEGKSTNAECELIRGILLGTVSFGVIFAATGTDAENSLSAIKKQFEENDLLLADYPEVCSPVRALENVPNRAHYQVITGKRVDNGEDFGPISSRFSWCGREIKLPKVPGSICKGSIIATRGLDSAVRGLKIGTMRPDIAIIDDPDTMETVNSDDQADKLEGKIDKGIAGLAGQQRRLARVMITTIQRRRCVSAKFTDPQQKASWHGKRFKFLVEPPERLDLWDDYIQQRTADLQTGDEHARAAHALYISKREAMDAGAVVANPHRFDPSILPDGTQVEASSLQRFYNLICDLGPEAVATEYQNDPPEESGPMESGITSNRVQCQVSGFDRRVVPPGCIAVTQGVDCRKIALHYVVRAWQADGTGYTIDYGVHEVYGTTVGSDEGVDLALRRAIIDRQETIDANPYRYADGTIAPVNLTLVDAGWRTQAVYTACNEVGLGIMPSMGFGRSAGCTQANFSDTQRRTRDRAPGDGWFLSRRGKLWLVAMDTDRWKSFEHDRWMTGAGKVGRMEVFGDASGAMPGRLTPDQKSHFSYSKHITAEIEVEEIIKGALRRYWKPIRDTNHYLDASYQSSVAANMCGIKLMKERVDLAAASANNTTSDETEYVASAPQAIGSRQRW